MSDEEQKRIFAENLRYYLDQHGYTQIEVAEKIGVSQQRFSSWCAGRAIPRMDKIQALADFFGIPKSYLIDERSHTPSSSYYVNPETARIAQQIYDDPDLRVLFDAAEDVSPESIRLAAEMLRRMKETNPDG